MAPNVIILTNGISGSSVLSGLIAKAGYWLGADTESVSYETYENSLLVGYNIALFKQSGFFCRDIMDIPPPSVQKIGRLYDTLDVSEYENFVAENDLHYPWLWKDPRLSYTIYFWKNLIDTGNCKFILMTRDLRQTWTGLILRANFAVPFEKLKKIHEASEKSARNFLEMEDVDSLSLTFEDLLLHPQSSIHRLNRHIGTSLALSDLQDLYKGKLGRARWTFNDYLKALLRFQYYKFIRRDLVTFPRRVPVENS